MNSPPDDVPEVKHPNPVLEGQETVTDKPIHPQSASPLFSHIPPEIRNQIFKLALTSFDDKTRPYKKGAFYYRPGFRYAHKIDTSLLLTCRRIFSETRHVPVSINEHTSWYLRPPPDVTKNALSIEDKPAALVRRQGVETIHLFTQQYWLESQFKGFTSRWKFTNATRLIITLRHTDFWWWENGVPIALDPKRRGQPSAYNPKAGPSDVFEEHSWGIEFRNISGLREFQLELETVASKKDELDAIVARASGWEFPLGDGNVLVLNKSKTTRTGWVGHSLGSNPNEGNFDMPENDSESITDRHTLELSSESGDWGSGPLTLTETNPAVRDTHTNSRQALEEMTVPAQAQSSSSTTLQPTEATTTAPVKPLTAKEKLVADGVRFVDEDLEPNVADDNQRMTYYVVTLTWYPRAVTDHDVRYPVGNHRRDHHGRRLPKVRGVRW